MGLCTPNVIHIIPVSGALVISALLVRQHDLVVRTLRYRAQDSAEAGLRREHTP